MKNKTLSLIIYCTRLLSIDSKITTQHNKIEKHYVLDKYSGIDFLSIFLDGLNFERTILLSNVFTNDLKNLELHS